MSSPFAFNGAAAFQQPTPSPVQADIKLRNSCDACQSLKVKCSQHKPACHRCSKHGLDCVYSPLRRMGRPKRHPAPATPCSSNTALPPTTSPSSSRHPSVSDADARAADDCIWTLPDHGGAGPDTQPGATTTTTTTAAAAAATGLADMMAADLAHFCHDVLMDGSQDAGLTSLMGNGGFYASAAPSLVQPPAPALTEPLSEPFLSPPSFAVHDLQPRPPRVGECGSGDRGQDEADGSAARPREGSCYVTILVSLSQLEQTLESSPEPRLDLVLSAEQGLRSLKERLFSCQGHNSLAPGKCLDAHGSSLLVLGLVAERVIGLLEDLFRRATPGAHGGTERTARLSMWFPGSPGGGGGGGGGGRSQASERQLERAVRGSFARHINCPVPEANCELTVGAYEVDTEVKARVIKQILGRRARALDRLLHEMAACAADRAMAGAEALAGDLQRRAELLQGRIELVE